jgi:hypothetical protein
MLIMRKSIKKILSLIIATTTIMGATIIPANAEWIHDSNGWWNTEGNSYSVGWRFIDNSWFYFGKNGYMQTGWVNDNGTWYYLNTVSNGSLGAMLTNTTTPDGYKVNDKGVWIKVDDSSISNETIQQSTTTNENTTTTNTQQSTSSTTSSSSSSSSSSSGSSSRPNRDLPCPLTEDTIDIAYVREDFHISGMGNSGTGVKSVYGYKDSQNEWYNKVYGVITIKASDFGLTPYQFYRQVWGRELQILDDNGTLKLIRKPKNSDPIVVTPVNNSNTNTGNNTDSSENNNSNDIPVITTPTETTTGSAVTVTTSSAVTFEG